MKYLVVVSPVNEHYPKDKGYLFTYDFEKTPETDMLVHCETKIKGGMYGRIIEWARMPKAEEERLVKMIKALTPTVTLPLKAVDIIYTETERRESE